MNNKKLALSLIVVSLMLGTAISLAALTRDQQNKANSVGSQLKHELQTINPRSNNTLELKSSQAPTSQTPTSQNQPGWDTYFSPSNFYNTLGDGFESDAVGSSPSGWTIYGDCKVKDAIADSASGLCNMMNPKYGHMVRVGGSYSSMDDNNVYPLAPFSMSSPVLVSFAAYAGGASNKYGECQIFLGNDGSVINIEVGTDFIYLTGTSLTSADYDAISTTSGYVHQIDLFINPAVTTGVYPLLPLSLYVDGKLQFMDQLIYFPGTGIYLNPVITDFTFTNVNADYMYLDDVWIGNPIVSTSESVVPIAIPLCYVLAPDVPSSVCLVENEYMITWGTDEDVNLVLQAGVEYKGLGADISVPIKLWSSNPFPNIFQLILSNGMPDAIVNVQTNYTIDTAVASLTNSGPTYLQDLINIAPVMTYSGGSYKPVTQTLALSASQFQQMYGYTPVDPRSMGMSNVSPLITGTISGVGYQIITTPSSLTQQYAYDSSWDEELSIGSGGMQIGIQAEFKDTYQILSCVLAAGGYQFYYGLPNSGGLQAQYGIQPYFIEPYTGPFASIGTNTLGYGYSGTTTLTIIGTPTDEVYISGLENYRISNRLVSLSLYLTANGHPSQSSSNSKQTVDIGAIPSSGTLTVAIAGGGREIISTGTPSDKSSPNSFTMNVYFVSTSNPPIAQISMTVYIEVTIE